ncbi:hypothetical protein IH982_01930 [Patescibacteria group bacterium]|nr:hypothetical protein [Patescibacteria group bacterium]
MNEQEMRQEKIALVTGVLFAVLGGAFGFWMGLEAASEPIGILAGMMVVAFVGYFFGVILGGILAAPPENGTAH